MARGPTTSSGPRRSALLAIREAARSASAARRSAETAEPGGTKPLGREDVDVGCASEARSLDLRSWIAREVPAAHRSLEDPVEGDEVLLKRPIRDPRSAVVAAFQRSKPCRAMLSIGHKADEAFSVRTIFALRRACPAARPRPCAS